MQKRALGKNGPMVSPVGFGCMSFVGFYGSTTVEESHRALARALDLDIDFLDTSNAYGAGRSEEIMGAFIKDHPNRFKIASKVGICRKPGETKRVLDNSPNHIRQEIDKTLQRLNVDHIDLYYIHRRDLNTPLEEVMGVMAELVQAGKIGGIGFSEIAPYTLRKAHALHPVAAVQSEYSLWTRLPELGMLQTCEELGVAFVPFSPLGRGILSDVTLDLAKLGDTDFRKGNPRFIEPDYSKNMELLVPFKEMAADKGIATATLALAWVLYQGDHLIPIPGTRTAAHLEEIAAAMHLTLTESDLAEINRLLPIGFAFGDRYSETQVSGTERYC